MKKNVLLLETVSDEALAILEENVNVFTAFDREALIEIVSKDDEMQAIITRGKGIVDNAMMTFCPELEVIGRCGVGLDNVDVPEATSRGIKVMNAPGANAGTIAEHTLSLMLMLMRNMYESVYQVKQDNWNWRNQYAGDELSGKTLGILGMGNIGKRVAKLGEAFGMNVVYWSRSKQDLSYDYLSMNEVLQQSDVVSLHLPFTKETGEILGADQLALMKSGALLINTARGALVNQDALVKALDEGGIFGYAADVLPKEPPVAGDPIVHHPRALITPHCGSLTATTYNQMCVYTVTNVVAALTGKEFDTRSVFNLKDLTK